MYPGLCPCSLHQKYRKVKICALNVAVKNNKVILEWRVGRGGNEARKCSFEAGDR